MSIGLPEDLLDPDRIPFTTFQRLPDQGIQSLIA